MTSLAELRQNLAPMAGIQRHLCFSAMFHGAFKDYDKDGKIWFRTDGSVLNNQKLKAKTSCMLLRDLLYADNCALIANSEEDTQSIVNDFARAADRYGLTISIKKTEVLHPPRPRTPPAILSPPSAMKR